MCCKTKESLLQYYIGKPMSVFAQIESHCKQLIQHRGLFLDSIAKRHLETMLKVLKSKELLCSIVWIIQCVFGFPQSTTVLKSMLVFIAIERQF